MLRLRTALSAGLPSALRRLFSTAVATKAQLARPAEVRLRSLARPFAAFSHLAHPFLPPVPPQLALPNVHRSDAELRVARVPVVEVDAEVSRALFPPRPAPPRLRRLLTAPRFALSLSLSLARTLAQVAMCDGGGGATGHPIEYVKLELREGHAAVPCKYCGVRYRRAAAHHH